MRKLERRIAEFALPRCLLVHPVVELLEERFVLLLAGFGGKAEWVNALDADFSDVRLGLQDLHDFGDEFVERHGLRVLGLLLAHERGLDVGRDDFDDFHARVF
jgi:hypothetical protein